MRLDGTEIGNPYAESAIDPTEVKAGDGTEIGMGSEAGNPYGNKINEMHEYITRDPTQKYDVLARAMRDPNLSETDRYGVLMSSCSPTEAGENLDTIFGNEQSVSVGPYSFHDPLGQIKKISDEKMAAVEASFEKGAVVVWDKKRDVLYSNKSEVLSNSINKALETIFDYSTNPEGAWYLANKKIGLFGYEVPIASFVLNYREMTGEREEIVRQYTERMGVEKVLDEHRDDIKREMKNYGLIDRILHRKELREQIAEKKYADEARNPIRTHEDVERLVDELNMNGYKDVVDALDFEALRQGKGKGKEIGELFGIKPVGDDDDAGAYMASGSPETLEFRQETDDKGIIHQIPNMPITDQHKKCLERDGYVIDYKDAEKKDAEKTVKRKTGKKMGENLREYLAYGAEKYDDFKNTIIDAYREMRSSEGRTKKQMLRDGGVNAGVKLVDLMGDGGDEIKRIMENADVYGSGAEILEVLRYYLHYDENRSDEGKTKGVKAREIGAEGAGAMGMYFQKHKKGIKKNLNKLGAIAFGALAVGGGVCALIGNDDGSSTNGLGGLQNGDLTGCGCSDGRCSYDNLDDLRASKHYDDSREDYDEEDMEEAILYDLKYRLSKSNNTVVLNDDLCEAAKEHSEDLINRDYFTHNSPENETPADRCRDAGYSGEIGQIIFEYGTDSVTETYRGSGYNIDFLYGIPEDLADDVVGRLLWEGENRDLLMEADEIGIGVSTDSERRRWAYVLTTANNPEAAGEVVPMDEPNVTPKSCQSCLKRKERVLMTVDIRKTLPDPWVED